jgi:hypothetical protein
MMLSRAWSTRLVSSHSNMQVHGGAVLQLN